MRLRPERKDHAWPHDFVHARRHEGRPQRLLVAVDEFTRECLAMDVARRTTSDDVPSHLSWLMPTRRAPAHIRPGNGPECTANAVREWLAKVGVKTLFIKPGSPWENG